MNELTAGVTIAVNGAHREQLGGAGAGAGLAEMTEVLRSESDRFLRTVRDA